MASYEAIREHIQPLNIMGGAFRKDCIYITAGNEEKFHIYTRYMPWMREQGDEWAGKFYHADADFALTVSSATQTAGFIACLGNTKSVISQTSPNNGVKGFELFLDVFSARGLITDLAVVGQHIYASSSGGAVYQRIANDNWREIALADTALFFADDHFTEGFNCLAGFSESEIYAGGNKGILWLCENGQWRELNTELHKTENGWGENIEQIICADDGNVYLNSGFKLLRGRKAHWETVLQYKPDVLNRLNKIAWFKGELFVVQNHRLKQFRDNALVTVAFPDFVPFDFDFSDKNLVSGDDFLLVTSSNLVLLFDGERWFNLFDKGRTEEELRTTGTFYDPREL